MRTRFGRVAAKIGGRRIAPLARLLVTALMDHDRGQHAATLRVFGLGDLAQHPVACDVVECPCAGQVSLDDLADHAGTDRFHLCREFARELGLPPYAFLTRARIARACILLRRGVPPSEAASLVGVSDQSQMHRHVVRVVGCTPGIYAGERRSINARRSAPPAERLGGRPSVVADDVTRVAK